jgi:hypothetical protein
MILLRLWKWISKQGLAIQLKCKIPKFKGKLDFISRGKKLKKPEYPEKATRTATSHTLTLSQELVSSTPHHEQELNSQL